jgi:hypothetical protein
MSALAVAARTAREARPRACSASVGPLEASPIVAVLCDARTACAAAAAVALALARLGRRPIALAAAVGAGGPVPVLPASVPAARRAVARLHGRGERAVASGRLLWLGGRQPVWASAEADAAGAAAAASAALGRATGVVRAPAALALPLVRTPALDRVLRWHDGIVIVQGDAADEAVLHHVRRSVAALDRRVAEMHGLPRHVASAALLGLVAPADAMRAVEGLGLGPWAKGGAA